MPDNTTITDDQLRTVFLATELGGNTRDLNRFSYAEKGVSTYSFRLLQFDVGMNVADVQTFLKENGFSHDDIAGLSTHGGLSRAKLNTLDAKLQSIPQEKMDEFTNQQLDKIITGVGATIDQVHKQNPAAADAISKDAKVQLGIADYENQFGSAGPQFIGFLAGKPESLVGGTVQAGDPPSREDIQKFINATGYGHDRINAAAVKGRAERFDEAMVTLQLDHATKSPGHVAFVLKLGSQGTSVQQLQSELAKLGYVGRDGKPLKENGDFGSDTFHAVERFQQGHHLKVDGIVGARTWNALEQTRARHVTPSLADPKNPDHSLYQQALAGVRKLDANLGRNPDQQSDQLAAALVVAAKREGMTKIDGVVIGEDGSRAFAVQGRLDSPLRQIAHVQTAEAVNTPIDKSSATAFAITTMPVTPTTQTAVPLQTQSPTIGQ